MDIVRKLDPIVSQYNGAAGTPEGQRVVSLDPAELRELVPHAVSSVRRKLRPDDEEDTDVLGVNTHELFYLLLRAVQNLDKRLSYLEASKLTSGK